jgi:hypothetical protein
MNVCVFLTKLSSMQITSFLCRTVICGLSGCTIFFDSIYKHHVKCVLIFPTNLSETFLILGRIQRGIVINVHSSSCKVPNILVRF